MQYFPQVLITFKSIKTLCVYENYIIAQRVLNAEESVKPNYTALSNRQIEYLVSSVTEGDACLTIESYNTQFSG